MGRCRRFFFSSRRRHTTFKCDWSSDVCSSDLTPPEYFSIVKALQAIEAANVAILLIDAADGVTEQDAHVAGYILERGRAVVLAVNKWDAAGKEARARVKNELAWKLGFLGFAES